jgi:uncharacterized protein involved in response to NO
MARGGSHAPHAALARSEGVSMSQDRQGRGAAWHGRPYGVAPHSLFFVVGAIVLAAGSLGWALVQTGILRGAPGRIGMPLVTVHALVMTFGFFPMFFAGFLYSTGLKWLRVAAVPMSTLAPAALAHLVGWAVFAMGLAWPDSWPRALGLALVAGGWSHVVVRLVWLVRSSRQDDVLHVRLIAGAGVVGAAAMWGCVAGVALGEWRLVTVLARASVWGFVALTFLAAAHRMIPFVAGTPFAAVDRRWPRLLLGLLAVTFVGKAVAVLHPPAAAATAPVEIVLGTVLLGFALRWPFVQSLRPRLLRMLYTGFVWLGIGLLLTGIAGAFGPPVLAEVGLHAFAAGFLGTTMLAMVSRVIAGQAGIAVVVDAFLWRLFVALQLAVLLRVAGPLLLHGRTGQWVIAGAALAWCAVWLPWAWRYGRLCRGSRARSS